MPNLTKKDLVKNWLLGYSGETCYNYERLQGLGNTNAFVPIIRALYPEERQAEELKKYLVFFNTEPSWLGTCIHGISAAMEEKRANGEDVSAEDIQGLRSALMGPLAGMGDIVSQSIAYPILAGICIQFALEGNVMGPILFEVVYKVLMLTLGYNSYMLGYTKGKDAIVDLLKSGIFDRVLEAVSIVGLMVVGYMTYGNVTLNLGFISWEVQNAQGGVGFNLQEKLFDSLFPGVLPLCIVLLMSSQLKKRVKPITIIVVTFIVAFVLVGIKALLGGYAA